MMTSAPPLELARLSPVTLRAYEAFTDSQSHLDPDEDAYHLKFTIVKDESSTTLNSSSHVNASTSITTLNSIRTQAEDSESDEESVGETDQNEGGGTTTSLRGSLVEGCYHLSIGDENIKELQGWRFGRGRTRLHNRGVELLLNPSEIRGFNIPNLFCTFRLHESSSIMIIKVNSPHVVEVDSGRRWRKLEMGEEFALVQRRHVLRFGNLEFAFQYSIGPDDEVKAFPRIRTAVNLIYDTAVEDQINFTPGEGAYIERCGYLYEKQTLASGGFGHIFRGIDKGNGNPVAVKAVRLGSKISYDEFAQEVKMGEICGKLRNCLPQLAAFCEHELPIGACEARAHHKKELAFLVTKLGCWDFSSPEFLMLTEPERLMIIRHTLEAMVDLHKHGIMHRDVSCQNLLVANRSPLEAKLFDYGKAVTALAANQPGLGPLPTVAPEVGVKQGDRYQNYTCAIDSWSWAYAIAQAYGYGKHEYHKMSEARHSDLFHWLEKLASDRPVVKELVDCLKRMLTWDPQARMTAATALAHPWVQGCFDYETLTPHGKVTKTIDASDAATASNRLIQDITNAHPGSTNQISTEVADFSQYLRERKAEEVADVDRRAGNKGEGNSKRHRGT